MQMMSNNINELAAALAKAQGTIRAAAKDKENPHFRSRYADLASVWEACRAPLSSNGLAVFQTTTVADDGGTILVTTLAHSSGQYMTSAMPVRPVKGDPQGLGSALTYIRRYALSAMVGVAPDDDDDGNAASDKNAPPAVATKRQPRQPDPEPAPSDDWKADARRIASAIDKARTHDECDALMADPAIPAIKQASAKAYDALLAKDSTRRAVLDAIPMAAE